MLNVSRNGSEPIVDVDFGEEMPCLHGTDYNKQMTRHKLESNFGDGCTENLFTINQQKEVKDARFTLQFTEPADEVYSNNLVKQALRNIPPYETEYRQGNFYMATRGYIYWDDNCVISKQNFFNSYSKLASTLDNR